MPILVRPVREQLEHDRIIRLLQAKWRRKYKVDANPGDERNVPVKVGSGLFYPDLVLTEEGGRKPHAVVEVETGESVNHLEAMSQWANLAKSKSPLYLFVPIGSVESARRLASDHQIPLSELWSYVVIGDQIRFTSVTRDAAGELDDDRMPLMVAEPPPPEVEAPKAEPPRVQARNGGPAAGRKAAPAKRPAPARPQQRPASRPAAKQAKKAARPAQSASKRRPAAKRAAARAATKRAPARASKSSAKKAVRSQKRK